MMREYEFFCDGQRIIQGPEHGDGAHWFFDTVELSLETGTHCFSARVWALGKWAPLRRISVHPGFFLAADSRFEPELSTGVADWETTPLKGIRFECGDYTDSSLNEWEIMRKATPWKPLLTTGVPHVFDLSEYPSDIASDALPWKCAVPGMNVFPGGKVWHYGFGPYLLPSELPSLELGTIGISGIDFPLTVCGGSKKEILLRLDNYYCFYPEIELSGTGELTLFYTEALVDSNGRKGNRNELAEKEFRFAKYDRFFAGENAFPVHPIYWRCGRFLKLVLKAGAGELTLHDLRLRETRYPWKFESEFHTESATVDKIGPALSRTVEMCSHDMFFDCPYHEALQYIGDTRIQALITNVLSRDRRLQRRAVRQFGWSFNFQGLPASHYPSRHRQCIPTFAPFWIGMVLDSCLYDADGPALAKELLPAVHAVVEYFENKRDGNGNVLAPRGWNYIEASLYPAEPERTDGTFELLWLYGLCLAERLESWIGSPAYQARLTAAIGPAKQAILRDYYRPEKHLFSQHKAKDVFNEVTQVLAVLSRRFPAECAEGLFEAKNILRCGYYFSHYYFEACGISDRMDCFLKRLREWEKVTENGMVTVPETDCGTTHVPNVTRGAQIRCSTIIRRSRESVRPRPDSGKWKSLRVSAPFRS